MARDRLRQLDLHATVDGDATQKAGRTIYKEAPYIKLWAEGSTDAASHIATAQDRKDYPQEWAAFEQQRANPQHSVMHLPGFSAMYFRYCEDAELFTIEALVAAEVNPELKALQDMGRRWLELLKPEARPEIVPPRKRGGRVKGSKNKPKAPVDVVQP